MTRLSSPILIGLILYITSYSTVLAEDLVLISNDVPPYSTIVDGKPHGIFPDLVLEASRRINGPQVIQYHPWKRAYSLAQHGKDHLLFPLARTEFREGDFKWVIPLYKVEMAFIGRKGSVPATIESAYKAEFIVTKENTPMAQILSENNFPNVHLVSSSEKAARMLAAGSVDLWFTPKALAVHLFRQLSLDSSDLVIGETIQEADLYVGASSGMDEETLQKWQKAFHELLKDGSYDTIIKKYSN